MITLQRRLMELYDTREFLLYERTGAHWTKGYVGRRSIGEILKLLKCGTILEVGVGTAGIAQALAEKGFKCFGVDISRRMLKVAKNKKYVRHLKIELACMDAHKLAFREDCFDNILCVRTFRMLSSSSSFLREAARSLKNGGRPIVTFETCDYLPFRLALKLGLVPFKEFDKYYRLTDVLRWLKKTGFRVYAVKKLFVLHPLFYGLSAEQLQLYSGNKMLKLLSLIFFRVPKFIIKLLRKTDEKLGLGWYAVVAAEKRT